nr:redoxin domain-containing protein [Pirellula sp.]
MAETIYSLNARSNDGQEVSLEQYRGRVLLIVNLASKCGFTPQYSDLQALQKEFGDRGFSVLGFPCNQFGMQ